MMRTVPRGFTLLELMLAMVLFAAGTLASMELLHRAQAGAADGEHVLLATQLAQRRLEELRNVGYTVLASEAQAPVTDPPGFSRFSRQVQVSPLFSDTLREVEVIVSWKAPGGTADVRLHTYRSNTR
jgi:prepilin-type N-terminal cleavage/methylation domain-containing protein